MCPDFTKKYDENTIKKAEENKLRKETEEKLHKENQLQFDKWFNEIAMPLLEKIKREFLDDNWFCDFVKVGNKFTIIVRKNRDEQIKDFKYNLSFCHVGDLTFEYEEEHRPLRGEQMYKSAHSYTRIPLLDINYEFIMKMIKKEVEESFNRF